MQCTQTKVQCAFNKIAQMTLYNTFILHKQFLNQLAKIVTYFQKLLYKFYEENWNL